MGRYSRYPDISNFVIPTTNPTGNAFRRAQQALCGGSGGGGDGRII